MEVFIKRTMQQLGVTTKELAERMGKSPQNVSNIVNGGKNMSMNTLQQVADALGVPPYVLLQPDEALPTGSPTVQPVCPHCGRPVTVHLE